MIEGLENIISDIQKHVDKTGEQYLSIRTIANKGWLIGAKYSSVKKLVDGGLINSFSLNLGSDKREPIKKVHYKDLVNYITNSANK